MKHDYLKFINYPIIQDETLFKVNTDTVILGMFLDSLKGKEVLDIGTNTGALLMYAFYYGAKYLYGVDIHKKALDLANKNLSSLTDNFKLYNCRIQDLSFEKVDVIVCNPPFFEMNNVTKDELYKDAMFEQSLPLDELFSAFRKFMKDNGEVYLIYPADRFPELYQTIVEHKLKIMKMQFVHDEAKSFASRVLVKLKIGKMSKLHVLKPIIIKSGEIVV